MRVSDVVGCVLFMCVILSAGGGAVAQYDKCVVLRTERSGFEPWPGNCVLFLGKKLHSHRAFFFFFSTFFHFHSHSAFFFFFT